MPLTARSVATKKPQPDRRLELVDETVPGLSLRVTPSGHKSWSLHYRTVDGRQRRLTLGVYPSVSLAKARVKARTAIHQAGLGGDPAGDKQRLAHGDTFGHLAKEYLENYAQKHKRSWRGDERMLNADILPAWRARAVVSITRRDVRDLVDVVAKRAPIAANRTLALIRKMFNYAIGRDWIEANVASLIQKPGAERSRERVLTDEELRLVWKASATESAQFCGLMRLRLITAQRGGELTKIRWKDIVGDWLTLPGAITKNKLAHRVPLSPLAKATIKAIPSESEEYVFVGRGGRRPLDGSKKSGRRIAAAVLLELQQRDPTLTHFDFRGHDLRRTAATRMAELGIPRTDISKVLNHVDGGGARATQVYDRYQYDREKKLALDAWGRRLKQILEPKKARGRDVLTFRRPR